MMTVPMFWGVYFSLYERLKLRLAGVQPLQGSPWAQQCIAAVGAGAAVRSAGGGAGLCGAQRTNRRTASPIRCGW